MLGDDPLAGSCRTRRDDIAEWLLGRGTAEPSGSPFAKIVLCPPFHRLSKNEPWLPHGARHDTDLGEFLVGVFRPIPATHRHSQANDFTSAFQPCANRRSSDDVGQQWIGGDQYLRARHEHPEDGPRPTMKEEFQGSQIARSQNCEARKWRALMTVITRRNPPHASLAGAELRLLVSAILHESVRRIRHDRVNALRCAGLQPCEAVRFHESRSTATVCRELL